jgi:hypothetical protein
MSKRDKSAEDVLPILTFETLAEVCAVGVKTFWCEACGVVVCEDPDKHEDKPQTTENKGDKKTP